MEYAVQDEVNYISVEANADREFLWARCLILPDASTPDHRLSLGRKERERERSEKGDRGHADPNESECGEGRNKPLGLAQFT